MADTSQEALELATERIPVEVWQKILLDLDYLELKVVQRVCRGWKELIETPAFDQVLFRCPSDPRRLDTLDPLPVLVNPVVKYLCLDVSRLPPSLKLKRGSVLSELGAVASEMLTYPSTSTASGEVELETGLEPWLIQMRAHMEGGVSIAAVVNELQEHIGERDICYVTRTLEIMVNKRFRFYPVQFSSITVPFHDITGRRTTLFLDLEQWRMERWQLTPYGPSC